MSDTARGTFERVRGREPRALAELATLHGRSLVGVAFAVLQNLPASERAAADAIAECWRMDPEVWPRDPNLMAGELLAAAARAALTAHGRVIEVDPTPRPGATELLGLDPRQRAQAALRVLGTIDPEAEPLSPPIEAAVRANLAGLPANITAEPVREALRAPTSAQRTSQRGPLLMLAGGVAAAAIVAVLAATTRVPETEREAAVQQPTPAASHAGPLLRPSGPLTLEDCGIGPPDATLAFSGWVTPRRLGLATADLNPARPVLALVPEDEVAWNPPGGPRIMPPVRGRMACLSDTKDGTLIVVGLPSGWMPPATVRGFPGGPIEGPDGGPRPSDTG